MDLAQLFRDRPGQWGLRGDPYLWDELAAAMGQRADPETEQGLRALLEQAYEQLTGAPLSSPDPIYIERYSHGGMSSGTVSPQFWRATALPLLLARYRERSQGA